ncbi:unnamed protein product [Adineta steineri]|uniref:Apple domain-containing protein n=2 Tax=Adineta steineri TaxID=433720 RepID=A0A815GHW9_9BILA|nr:unnamed protein product [Adineta steineri]CAF3599952.1 unnamed protein product [Adineta steineri]
MASRRICLWLVFMIITQSVEEDMRSVRMSAIRGQKFQCASSSCLPFNNVITSTIMKCRMACLAQIYCRAASFHQSTSNCELFTDMSNEIANMTTDTDITTMIVIAGTRSPPALGISNNRLRQHQQQHQHQHQQQRQQPQPQHQPQRQEQQQPQHQPQPQQQQQLQQPQHQQQRQQPQPQHQQQHQPQRQKQQQPQHQQQPQQQPRQQQYNVQICTLSSQSSWSQTATTIFGSQAGTGGSTLSLLSTPIGMYYDQPNNRLIVADFGNQRIIQFSLNNPPSVATVIAGSNGQGCNLNQFTTGVGVTLDSSGQLYVSDASCNRITRFPSGSNSTTTATLIGSVNSAEQISINTLTNDIYVVGLANYAIYKFVGGSGSPVVAAGGNGNGNALNQLSSPNGVYYDYLYTNSLYVADSGNYRIMKYPSGSTGSTTGTVVAGGNGAGSGVNQMNGPRNMVVDSNGNLYIVDGGNSRIQRWMQNANSSTTIVGGTQGTASNQLSSPETALFDKYNNLLVVDRGNNRIQFFGLATC